MPSPSPLSRVSRVDFFAALPAGVFVVLSSLICLHGTEVGDSLIAAFSDFVAEQPTAEGKTGQLSTSGRFFFFSVGIYLSYIIGMLIRSIPVDYADARQWFRMIKKTIRIIRRTIRRFEYLTGLAVEDFSVSGTAAAAAAKANLDFFPYPVALLDQFEYLNNPDYRERMKQGTLSPLPEHPDADREKWMVIFYYWKNYLGTCSPDALAYYEAFEARSRFAASMVWASIVGAVVAAFAWLGHYSKTESIPVTMFGVSLFLAIGFAFNIRRLREHEAKTLLDLFIAVLEKQKLDGKA